MIRAFLAVELSPELRVDLVTVQHELKRRIEPERKQDVRMAWAQATSIHLTLKCLGNVDEHVLIPCWLRLNRRSEVT